MAKPSEDLSALFRSLRPDESNFQNSTDTAARDVMQRWPLFKAVAPEKSPETPALSALERQRWSNHDKPEFNGRKPALSLPGLSDKMAESLSKMAAQAGKKIILAKSAVRGDPDRAAELVANNPAAHIPLPRAAPLKPAGLPENRSPGAAQAVPVKTDLVFGDAAALAFAIKAPAFASAPIAAECSLPAASRNNDSFKSIFSRLEAKTEAVAKPAGNRSSFMDRLGKR